MSTEQTPPPSPQHSRLSVEIDPSDRLVSSQPPPSSRRRRGASDSPPPPMSATEDHGTDQPPQRARRPVSGRAASGRAASGRQSGSGRKRPKRSWGKRLLIWGLTACIWMGIGLAGVIAYYAIDLPDIDQVSVTTRRPSVVFLSTEGETFAAYGDIYGRPLALSEISPFIPQAVMATEDRRFFNHIGLDFFGLLRAVITNVRAGHVVQGGSTITQQLAKNLFLTPERNMKRKVQEVLMALWLEHRFTKEQLLTIYLNRVYLGSGTFGVDAAAKRYFDVSARDTNLYQSAVIAGLLKAPSRYSPLNNPEASHKRTEEVLQNMVEAGYISQETADMTKLSGAAQINKRPLPAGRYFADWVMAHLDKMGDVQGQDIVVRTTLSMSLQRKAEADLKAMLEGPGQKASVSQGAVVVLSPDGAIRALVGGKDYDDSQFNRATQGLRQPGSSFKSFVYLAAMERGHTPADIFDDSPIKLGNWSPGNYTGKYEGPISLHHAFATSSNTVAVRLIESVGPANVIATAHKLGIASELRKDASLSLGTSEVTLLEMTGAYAPFANGGWGIVPYGVDSITDPNGNSLWQRQSSGFGRVISDQALAYMHQMMQSVITEGTGKSAKLDRPAAGKTGTTQDYRDAWFLGYTADYVAGVWLGNDDQRREMKKVTGGGLPASLWKSIMLTAHRGLPARSLPTPDLSPAEVADGPGALIGDIVEDAARSSDTGNALDSLINSLFGR